MSDYEVIQGIIRSQSHGKISNALRLSNTLSGQTEKFVPANREHISLYVCGPTVYNFAHVGNARPAVVFNVLYRLLKRTHPRVTYTRNFIDIDDKINAAAETAEITNTYIEAYQDDMAALGILVTDIEARVGGKYLTSSIRSRI